MCFSTAASRFASEYAMGEPDACALADWLGACATAPPNTNADTSTAATNFIKFSVVVTNYLEVIDDGSIPWFRCAKRFYIIFRKSTAIHGNISARFRKRMQDKRGHRVADSPTHWSSSID
jgi:hypothetical protein